MSLAHVETLFKLKREALESGLNRLNGSISPPDGRPGA